MSEREKPLEGEILGPEKSSRKRPDPDQLVMQLPPDVPGMTLDRAILGKLQYWGARRTIDAYRKMIEAGTQSVQAQAEFLEAGRELIREEARLNKREEYREAARLEADEFLDRQKTRRNAAEVERLTSEHLLAIAREQDEELAKVIAKNNQEAERLRSERALEEERQKLNETQGGRSATFQQRMRRMREAKQNYTELQTAKAEDIEKYGGEENLPEFLQHMYDQIEADLLHQMDEQ